MPSGDTSSSIAFQKVNQWIIECDNSHTLCRPPYTKGSFAPRRLIEISTNGTVLLRECLQDRKYACLSHCWGSTGGILKTTSKTIDTFFREGIPHDQLSRTFQDAIDICRRLEVGYLWIDSMCIIQDSEEDWMAESVKMADIYEHAYLTIAATKSKDGSGGCYSKSQTGMLQYQYLTEHDVYMRRRPLVIGNTNSIEAKEYEEQWPLLSRGWVYQEMRVSRRVLHFAAAQITWQCRTHRLSEYRTGDGPSDEDDGYRVTAARHSNSWFDCVGAYAQLQLSFDKDRLVALSAIAYRELEKRSHEDRYLAGLWESTLLYDMTWSSWEKPRLPRPQIRYAPSWSWASVNGAVDWSRRQDSLRIPEAVEIVAVDYKPVGPVHLGQYSDATIGLRGPLVSSSLDSIWDLERAEGSTELGKLTEHFRISEFRADYDFYSNGQFHLRPKSEVSVAPIIILPGILECVCLVLAKTKDTHTLERVGIMYINSLWGKHAAQEDELRMNEALLNEALRSLPISGMAIA